MSNGILRLNAVSANGFTSTNFNTFPQLVSMQDQLNPIKVHTTHSRGHGNANNSSSPPACAEMTSSSQSRHLEEVNFRQFLRLHTITIKTNRIVASWERRDIVRSSRRTENYAPQCHFRRPTYSRERPHFHGSRVPIKAAIPGPKQQRSRRGTLNAGHKSERPFCYVNGALSPKH